MPNQARASYTIKIGESEYTLRPTFEAVMEFQDKAGMGVFEAIKVLEEKQDAKVVTSAIWAGILGEAIFQGEKELAPSFNQIGNEIMGHGIRRSSMDAFDFLYRASAPDSQKKSVEKLLSQLRKMFESTMKEKPQKS